MPVKDLPIMNFYDVQRFLQYSPQDCANWYSVETPSGKKSKALYPTMGRKHITSSSGVNVLNYSTQPRKIFKSISFLYVVVGSVIYQVDQFLNSIVISTPAFTKTSGALEFDYLPTVQTPSSGDPPSSNTQAVFCMFCDGTNIFVIDESTGSFTVVDDTNAPPQPLYVAAFGNRFVVSSANSTQFQLTQVNLGAPYDKSTCFTVAGQVVFAQESGIIRQMTVLFNNLYIFTDYTTGVWSNTFSYFSTSDITSAFPFKKNTSYNLDYGIADPDSLDVDFGMMVWLGQNRNGLVTFLSSNGQSAEPISTQAVNTLLQSIANTFSARATGSFNTSGFLYQYEDTIFYRASIGSYIGYETLDRTQSGHTLEFVFERKEWHRCIEVNGERNIIQEHEFFANRHIVTCLGQTCLYNMSGQYYYNEIQNTAETNHQAIDAFIAQPFRYENVTPIIFEADYSEFITDYVQIDFVFGDNTFIYSTGATDTTVFIIKEGTEDNPIYLVSEDRINFIVEEGTQYPGLSSSTYGALYKPHIELFWSEDSGISYNSADVLEFSQLGIYSWRMRWYQLGASRNRVYKLICVSPAPIVILGAVQNVRRSSGGAN
jgi:hypothetical protein